MPGVVYDDDFEKKVSPSDDCPIKNSALCYWLGEGKCDVCEAYRIKDLDTRRHMARNWDVMLSNLPEDIDDLGNSDTCVLCKGHTPNKTECYGLTDLAHPDPPAKKGIIMGFGKKVRIPIGSMFSLHFAACKECRNRIRMINLSLILWFVGMIVAGVVVSCLPVFVSVFGDNALLVDLGVIVAFAVAGWFIGKAVSKSCARKAAKYTHVDLREIPQIRDMFRNRWFIYDGNKDRYSDEFRLFFSNKKDFKNIFPPEDFKVDSKETE